MCEDRLSLKPLDLSNMLKHAFLSGRDSQKGTGQTRMEAWAEYDPTENDAYLRIEAILKNFDSTRPEAAQVRVKALDWFDYGTDRHPMSRGSVVEECGAFYRIEAISSGWEMIGSLKGVFNSLDEAKAAAQANYERRIRAALEPDTVTGWQDISTAPKGEKILVCQARNGIIITAVQTEEGTFKTGPSVLDFIVGVSHWMPLPPAPEKEG